MRDNRMILQHTSGKYYEIIRVHGVDMCGRCDIRGGKCTNKGFTCNELRDILDYNCVFKEVEL